jgi:hypothetical protein
MQAVITAAIAAIILFPASAMLCVILSSLSGTLSRAKMCVCYSVFP